MRPTISHRSLGVAGIAAVAAFLLACPRGKAKDGVPNPDLQRLGGIVGQPLLITPAQSIRIAPELAWTNLPRAADILASLDRALTDTLRARVANQQWVYADAVVESARNNPTY